MILNGTWKPYEGTVDIQIAHQEDFMDEDYSLQCLSLLRLKYLSAVTIETAHNV